MSDTKLSASVGSVLIVKHFHAGPYLIWSVKRLSLLKSLAWMQWVSKASKKLQKKADKRTGLVPVGKGAEVLISGL